MMVSSEWVLDPISSLVVFKTVPIDLEVSIEEGERVNSPFDAR